MVSDSFPPAPVFCPDVHQAAEYAFNPPTSNQDAYRSGYLARSSQCKASVRAMAEPQIEAAGTRSPLHPADGRPAGGLRLEQEDLHAILAEAKEHSRDMERELNETKGALFDARVELLKNELELADRGTQDTLQVDTLRADLETTRALPDCTCGTSPRTAPE
ncbi:hypothetical protein AURDEDRAFT_175240 [Auricularia subglabra TFB-10046 SS5]|nr:hypothetical protein AURDEDRAFT_175240 [Auricularia subglabra TFB-10046 SS5]